MARALVDLRINEGDQFLLYLRNLPEKVSEHVQLISGAGTVQQLWRAVTEYYIRSRVTGTMERAHAVQGSPIRSKGCFNCGDPGHMQSECPKPKRCKHCGKSGHVASDCWEKHPDKRPSKKDGADPVKKPFQLTECRGGDTNPERQCSTPCSAAVFPRLGSLGRFVWPLARSRWCTRRP